MGLRASVSFAARPQWSRIKRQAEDHWAAHVCCRGTADRLRHSLDLGIRRRMREIYVSAIAGEEAYRAAAAADGELRRDQ